MDKFEVLKKFRLKDDADREIKRKLKNHRGATDLLTQFNIYKDYLNREWAKTKNNLHELINKTCDRSQEFPSLPYQDCYSCYHNYKHICQECGFYNEKIKPLEEAMSELNIAEKEFDQSRRDDYLGI